MAASEFIELIIQAQESAGSGAMNFVTVLFAYLVTTYFVASRLSRIQVWGITVIYTAFMATSLVGILVSVNLTMNLITQFAEVHPDTAPLYYSTGYSMNFRFITAAFYLLAWLGSVLNMWYTRKRSANDA
jgi:hypothetical protein